MSVLSGFIGIAAGVAAILPALLLIQRATGGEWIWQSHLRSKCRCGILYDPTDQCPGARMGRGPRGAS